jgi:hypothetical protein
MIVTLKTSPFGKHSFFHCYHFLYFVLKLCEILQTLIVVWLVWSKGLPSIVLVFEEPSSPKLIDHSDKLVCKNLGSLLPSLMEAFIIEHILTCLFIDPSMKWCLCCVRKVWYEVVGDTIIHLRLWNVRTSLIFKQFLPNNFPRCYLKTHLHFEIDCLEFCLPLHDLLDLNNSNNWHL